VAALSGYKDFLLKTGFIEKDFSVAAWVDPTPLERVLSHLVRKAA
jgi:ABC-type nitrate/sulfonate/bicarbonate transport system substrate-binding protein